MSYQPSTDFLALMQSNPDGSMQLARMPGLDFVAAAIARMGMCRLWTGQEAPPSDFKTTVWIKPALPSWTAEGTIYLYNVETSAFEIATPELWAEFFSSSALAANVYETAVAAAAAIIPDAINVVLTLGLNTPGDGGGANYKRVGTAEPAHDGAKFQTAGGVWWDYVPDAYGINVKVFGAKGDDANDDAPAINDAVEFADGAKVWLPEGIYRCFSSIVRLTSATESWRNGMQLQGEGRGTVLKAMASNMAVLLWDIGYVPVPAGAAGVGSAYLFTRGSSVNNLLINQAAGLTGVDGIRMTAAFDIQMHAVAVEGMSGRGFNIPFRADINAGISDPWQCFSLSVHQCRFSECSDWGVYFGGGQSPGLWEMRFCTIANNTGGGLYTTTGQFVCTDNLFTGNGSNGGNGCMFIDAGSLEGPSYVALIERNEFDTCWNYFLWMVQCRNTVVRQNRFLSTFSPLRPGTHVRLGDGSPKIVWNCLFELNYHRSVWAPLPTTDPVFGYAVFAGSDVEFNRFVNNDIRGANGISQNSSGLIRYTNIDVGTAANVIVDGNPTGVAANAAAVTAIGAANTTVTFGTEIYDTGFSAAGVSSFNGTSFTVPVPGRYRFNATVPIVGLTLGNTVTVSVLVNGATVRNSTQYAGGLGTQSFDINVDLLLNDTDVVSIQASQNSGSNKNTVIGSSTRIQIEQITV